MENPLVRAARSIRSAPEGSLDSRYDVPLPAVFAGSGRWKIMNGNRYAEASVVWPTDSPHYIGAWLMQSGEGAMISPVGNGPGETARRFNAYGKMLVIRENLLGPKFTDRTKEAGIHNSWAAAALTAVANTLMIRRGVQESAGLQVSIDHLAESKFPASIALALLTLEGTSGADAKTAAWCMHMKKTMDVAAAFSLEPLRRTLVDLAMEGIDIVPVLAQLQAIFGTPSSKPPSSAMSVFTAPKCEAEGEALSATYGSQPEPKSSPGWGTMYHVKAPMAAMNRHARKLMKAWKRSFVGAFRYPWRALPSSDGEAFAVKKHIPGGTILLDCSGSMAIQPDQLRLILKHSPAAAVACYGSAAGSSNKSGVLVSVAEEGVVMKEDFHVSSLIGSGNVVDGPALRWLSTMPEPRIWISDGQVTGVGDGQMPGMKEECEAISKKARIVRCGSISELLVLLVKPGPETPPLSE